MLNKIFLSIFLFLVSINFHPIKFYELIKSLNRIFTKKERKNYTDKSEVISEYIPQEEIKNLIQEDLPFIKAENKSKNTTKFKLPDLDLLKTPSKKERNKLFGLIKKGGITLVPLFLYSNEKGIAKLDLGIAKGKRKEDKRETIKQRDWNRQKSKILKDNN